MVESFGWQVRLARLACRAYFNRLTVLNSENLPHQGPVLYLSSRRNGGVDDLIYRSVLPRASIVDRGECLEVLRANGEALIFCEDYPQIGARRSTFDAEASGLILDCLERRLPIVIMPVGLAYEEPWAFRSDVEVVIGDPINTELPEGEPEDKLRALRTRVTEALETVNVSFASEESRDLAESLAAWAALDGERSYWKSLKSLEAGIPPRVMAAWRDFEPAMLSRSLWRHEGVSLFPAGGGKREALALALIAPVVLGAIAANLPAYAAAWWAGSEMPDDPSHISYWKVAVGGPSLALWFMAVCVFAMVSCCPLCALTYAALTAGGVLLYHRFKRSLIAVLNGLTAPGLGQRFWELRRILLAEMPDV